jgi:hypothetical protein
MSSAPVFLLALRPPEAPGYPPTLPFLGGGAQAWMGGLSVDAPWFGSVASFRCKQVCRRSSFVRS